MIILQGPNELLRARVLHRLELKLGANASYLLSGEPRPTLEAHLQLAQTDHLNSVHSRLSFHCLEDPALQHMVGYAHRATGTLVVICHSDARSDDEFEPRLEHLLEVEAATGWTGLSYFRLYAHLDVGSQVDHLLQCWREQQVRVCPFRHFNFSGCPHDEATMVVGDRVHPYLPYDVARRLAFTGLGGSSRTLHEALVQYPQGRFYLTNAHKCERAAHNRDLLVREIELLEPARIVAMGDVAQRYLADLRVDFVRTFHPQYWRRFRSDRLSELAALFS